MANSMDSSLLKKIFGAFVILAGIKEFFSKKEKPETHSSDSNVHTAR